MQRCVAGRAYRQKAIGSVSFREIHVRRGDDQMVPEQLARIAIAEDGPAITYLTVVFGGQLCAVALFNDAMKVPQKNSFRKAIVLERRPK